MKAFCLGASTQPIGVQLGLIRLLMSPRSLADYFVRGASDVINTRRSRQKSNPLRVVLCDRMVSQIVDLIWDQLADQIITEGQGPHTIRLFPASSRFKCHSTAPQSRPSSPPVRKGKGIHSGSKCYQAGANVRRALLRTNGQRACGRRVYHGQGSSVVGEIRQWKRRRRSEGVGPD